MNISPMLEPWQWVVLAVLPPAIVLLYFLKLKRRPVEVPSTWLWRRSIEDLRVNSLWQRLRQNILLYLQLLVIMLVALACLRLLFPGEKKIGRRTVFMIDNSASMSATDVAPTRLDSAKSRVLALIDQMETGDVAMVIAFSNRHPTVRSFTDDKRQLRDAVEAIGPTQRPTDATGALQAAAARANPGSSGDIGGGDVPVAQAQPATVLIFSDGQFPPVKDFAAGNLTIKYQRIGKELPSNFAITSFRGRRKADKSQDVELLATLANFTGQEAKLGLDLYLQGVETPIDSDEITVPARGESRVAYPVSGVESAVFELRLRNEDDLPLDNRAYAAFAPPQPGNVLLVTPGNRHLELAFTTPQAARLAKVTVKSPAFLQTAEYEQAAAGGVYDLVIYDRVEPPKAMPVANTLFVGRIPPWFDREGKDNAPAPNDQPPGEQPADDNAPPRPPGKWLAGARRAGPTVIDVDDTHPLMRNVNWSGVKIAEAAALDPPPGATVLVESQYGPLYAGAPRGGHFDAVLGFEIIGEQDGKTYVNTNWPTRPGFALFARLTLSELATRSPARESVRPGDPFAIYPPTDAATVLVTTPWGATLPATRGGAKEFFFDETREVGLYEARFAAEGPAFQQQVVNLFDPRESDLRPAETITHGYTDTQREAAPGEEGYEPARREAWPYVVLACLVVVLVEWFVFCRRIS